MCEKCSDGIIINRAQGDGWKSRKFWVSNGSAFAVLVFAFAARWADKIGEPTLQYLATVALVAVATYCGFNLAEKFGGMKALLAGGLKKLLPAGASKK